MCRAAPSVANHNFDFSNGKILNIVICDLKSVQKFAAERAISYIAKVIITSRCQLFRDPEESCLESCGDHDTSLPPRWPVFHLDLCVYVF